MSISVKTPTFPTTRIRDFREEEETMRYEFTKKEEKEYSHFRDREI